MQNLKIYYMRDNHTYRSVSLNVDEALAQIKEEWAAGYTCGMLCCKIEGTPKQVHAYGSKRWNEFEANVRTFYSEISGLSQGELNER